MTSDDVVVLGPRIGTARTRSAGAALSFHALPLRARHEVSVMAHAKTAETYRTIVRNRNFEIHVLNPKSDRRDNIRVTLHSDDGVVVHHHLRSFEVVRLMDALHDALAFGPAIPQG
jgi:hypothetical protein